PKKFFQEIYIELFSHGHLKSIGRQSLSAYNLFTQSLRIGNHDQWFAVGIGNSAKYLRPHEDIGVLGFIKLIWALVRHREQQDFALEEVLEVILKISGFFFLLEHRYVISLFKGENGGRQNGVQATGKPLQRNPDRGRRIYPCGNGLDNTIRLVKL